VQQLGDARDNAMTVRSALADEQFGKILQ